MNNPIVSVVMTVHNCSKFLIESINSLKNQTFKNFEIIIYDDGSTDNTYEIAKSCENGDFCIKIFHSDMNRGVGIGRNEAIKHASGDYIAIQDGDDISLSDRLQKEVNLFISNPCLFCVGAGIIKINENGEEIKRSLQPSNNLGILKKMVSGINPIFDPTCMFNKSMFMSLGQYSFSEDTKYVPDWDLWIRACLNGCLFFNIKEYMVQYRVHSNSNCVKYVNNVFRQHSVIYHRNRRNLIKKGELAESVEYNKNYTFVQEKLL